MAEGLRFAQLAALVGKKHAARWGSRRVAIGAVGIRDGERFVMGTLSDGTAVLGQPCDFAVPDVRPRRTPRERRTRGAMLDIGRSAGRVTRAD